MTEAATVSPALWQGLVMSGIGGRVAAYRKRRGLSQTTLASLVGRSESWLSQVERGLRDVDSLTVIRDLSRALKVPSDILIGSTLVPPPAEAGHDSANAVHRYLDGYLQLLTAPQVSTFTAEELLAAVAAVGRDYQAARYDEALQASSALLAEVDALARTDSTAATTHVYISAYVITAKILHKVGENRLAALAADRAATMASRPSAAGADRGLAAREVVLALLYTGQADAAEALAVDMATSLEADPDAASPVLLSLRGSLLLLAAVVAARRAERYEALDRLRQAELLATELGADDNHGWTAFGPTNVAIHAVSVAAALGDAGEALRLSSRIDVTRLPEGLHSRRAQLHLDLAWAYTKNRRDAEAVLQLLEVEKTAPQLIRYHPVVAELVKELFGRTRAGTTGIVYDLAGRAGVLD